MTYKNIVLLILLLACVSASMVTFTSCGNESNIITQFFTNEVTAKQRLDSANAQSTRKYGVNTKLVLIVGKNVKSNGKTDIATLTAITNPDSIGTWLYIYKTPPSDTLRIYTPNPLPGASDCIELTAFYNINSLIGLIQDTSTKNMVGDALNFIVSNNVSITTQTSSLLDSDSSLNLANTSDPIIRFDPSFIPDTSHLNGNVFFSTGTNKTINMFLIPAWGTLHLSTYIPNLIGFPPDLWIVNYKKTDTGTTNLILGTVVQSGQIMGINNMGLTSRVINLSKYSQ
jgi:hypothetical protein